MTLYGVGLGPGDMDLVTVRGQRILDEASVVYSPGRLSRSVATDHVPEARIGDLDIPMTRDEQALREAWKDAAKEIAPQARDDTVAFVTLGDPNVYSTFGHLRRTFSTFYPSIDVETVPGVSAVTAFSTALGIEISAGASLTLHEAARGEAPTGPDRMILFKVTDVPTTHEQLVKNGYDVLYGRRLFMEQGETVITDDPEHLTERDYYTLAYAEKRDLDTQPATARAAFEAAGIGFETETESETETGNTDAGSIATDSTDRPQPSSDVRMERAEGESCGDETVGSSHR